MSRRPSKRNALCCVYHMRALSTLGRGRRGVNLRLCLLGTVLNELLPTPLFPLHFFASYFADSFFLHCWYPSIAPPTPPVTAPRIAPVIVPRIPPSTLWKLVIISMSRPMTPTDSSPCAMPPFQAATIIAPHVTATPATTAAPRSVCPSSPFLACATDCAIPAMKTRTEPKPIITPTVPWHTSEIDPTMAPQIAPPSPRSMAKVADPAATAPIRCDICLTSSRCSASNSRTRNGDCSRR